MSQQWSNEHMSMGSGSPTRRKVNRNSSSGGHSKDVLLELTVASTTPRQQASTAAIVSNQHSSASIVSHAGANTPFQAGMHFSADSKSTRGCCSRLWLQPWFRVFMALVTAVIFSVVLAVSIRLGRTAGRSSQPPTDVGSRLDTVGMTLLFSDNFTSFNATNWSIEVGDGQDYGLQGWGNNELQCYTASRSNLDIAPHPDYPQDDSVLRIRPVYSPSPQPCVNLRSPTSPRHWTSAKVETKNKVAFTWSGQQIYRGPFSATGSTVEANRRRLLANASSNGTCGRVVVESRMKLPVALGRWSAFWMMPLPQPCPPSSSAVECGAFGSWPRSGEIDIIEQVNKDTEVLGTVHYADIFGNHQYQGGKFALSQAALKGWHIFQLAWNCTSLTWYVDAYPTYQLTRQQLAAANWPFDEPFFLIINTAIGGFLTRDAVPDKGESKPLLVDYVRVYGK